MNTPTINVTRSSMPDFEEYCEEIRGLWDSCWLTNMGVKHKQLQAQLEAYLETPHVTLFANGHLALEMLLAAMNFPRGSEIITTPFTFASTTHAIVRNGLIPVFCDVEPAFYTMDPSKIEALITEKTAAILPVHVYGNVCDDAAISAIARKHGLKVIYDAAHAFGVTCGGKGVAALGDASMFSFHATKVFNTIEGGAAAFSDDALVESLDLQKNFGIKGQEAVVFAGANAKMNEFQAAMGLCNLRHVEEEIERRALAAQRYRACLSGTQGIRLCPQQPGVKPNYAYFPVVFDGYAQTRDQMFERLKAEGIVARKYFFPLTNDFDCYRSLETAGKEKTPVAAHIADRVLTLPLYAGLQEEDVDRICDVILSAEKR